MTVDKMLKLFSKKQQESDISLSKEKVAASEAERYLRIHDKTMATVADAAMDLAFISNQKEDANFFVDGRDAPKLLKGGDIMPLYFIDRTSHKFVPVLQRDMHKYQWHELLSVYSESVLKLIEQKQPVILRVDYSLHGRYRLVLEGYDKSYRTKIAQLQGVTNP